MSSFVVDTRDGGIELIDVEFNDYVIKDICDILLLGYGREDDAGVFKSYCVNPVEFQKGIGWSWTPRGGIDNNIATNTITTTFQSWGPQQALYLGEKDDDLEFSMGDRTIKTKYGTWTDCEDSSVYTDVCHVTGGKTTGFYRLLHEIPVVTKIMSLGYKMFAPNDFRYHLNWVCFRTNNAFGTFGTSKVRKYFRVFYRTLPNRLLFTPSLLYTSAGGDNINNSHRNAILNSVGEALKGGCTEDFEYQDVSTTSATVTYNSNTTELATTGNVFRGFCINGGQFMEPGDGLFSPNLQYKAVVQYDGNFVVYTNAGNGSKEVWKTLSNAGTNIDSLLTRRSRIYVQTDENIVLRDRSNNPSWSAGTSFIDNNQVKLILDNNGYLVLLANRIGSTDGNPYYKRGSGLLNYKCVCGIDMDGKCNVCTKENHKQAYKDTDCVVDWKLYNTSNQLESAEQYRIKIEPDMRNWCYVNNYDLYKYHIRWASKKNGNAVALDLSSNAGSTATYGLLSKRTNKIFANTLCTNIDYTDNTLEKAAEETKYKYCIRGNRVATDKDCAEWITKLQNKYKNKTLKPAETNSKDKLDILVKKICDYDWKTNYPDPVIKSDYDYLKSYDTTNEAYRKLCSCYTPFDAATRSVWLENINRYKNNPSIVIPTVCSDNTCIENGFKDADKLNQTCNIQACFQTIKIENSNTTIGELGQSCTNNQVTNTGTPSNNASDVVGNNTTPPPDSNNNDKNSPPPGDDDKDSWMTSTWFYVTIGVIVFIIIILIGALMILSGKQTPLMSYGFRRNSKNSYSPPMPSAPVQEPSPMYEQFNAPVQEPSPMYEQFNAPVQEPSPMYEQFNAPMYEQGPSPYSY